MIVIGEDGSSNTVAISGRGCVLIVDTSLFPEKAIKIRKFVQEIFGKPVRLVVNTHYHPDHTFGNSAFEDLDILASSLTKEAMESMDFDYIESVWGRERAEREHIVIPNETFEDEISLGDCGMRIRIVNLGGHTSDSSVVFLEREGIVITGDLVMNGYHLEITEDSDIESWKEALDVIRDFSPLFVIPGHGKVGGPDIVRRTKDYLLKVEGLVSGRVSKEEVMGDSNFTERDFPELFSSSILNLLRSLRRV